MRKSLIHFFESRLRFGINCVKSDNFRSKAPENQSEPLFSKTVVSNERADGGRHPPEGGLSAGAGSGGFHGQPTYLIRHQVGALRALSEETFRGPTLIKVKSLKFDFDRRDPAGNFSAAFLEI